MGFAKKIATRTFTLCGTPDYLAPAILAHKGHNWAVVWGTRGFLAYEMLHGEPPFASDDQMATFKRITAGRYGGDQRVSSPARDLIRRSSASSDCVLHDMNSCASASARSWSAVCHRPPA